MKWLIFIIKYFYSISFVSNLASCRPPIQKFHPCFILTYVLFSLDVNDCEEHNEETDVTRHGE